MKFSFVGPGLCVLAMSFVTVQAAPPVALVSAAEYLAKQSSYTWETINGDPGPVAQDLQTRRGVVTSVQRNLSPSVKGRLALNGELLIQREWSDGLRLETLMTPSGAMVTNTPEGWMTTPEILTAQAQERMSDGAPSPRVLWLRRADRPDIKRPDEELPMFIKNASFEEISRDAFVGRLVLGPDGTSKTDENDPQASVRITTTINLRNGIIRDYEVVAEGSRRFGRTRVAVSDHRIVVLTYVPVARIDVPAEARDKLKTPVAPPR